MSELYTTVPLKCADCNQTVSGPDVQDVKETMARHTAKKHPKAKNK